MPVIVCDRGAPIQNGVGWKSKREPHYQEWGAVGLLGVYGAAVMPESLYELQFFDNDCGDVNSPACFLDPLPIATSRWTDVVSPLAGEGLPEPDFRDVRTFVEKFSGDGGPMRAAAELDPKVIILQGVLVDFKNIAASVASFIGDAYNHAGPAVCP